MAGSPGWRAPTFGTSSLVLGVVAAMIGPGCALLDDGDDDDDACTAAGDSGGNTPVPLKEAKLIIEHNATDEDTGFQGFLDGEGWQQVDVCGPDGLVLRFQAGGELRRLGLTELFFESVEPPNADVPIPDILAALPEGDYTFDGPTADGGRTTGTATLTHAIPAGPQLLAPAEGATVPIDDLVVRWGPVTETIAGEPVTIIRYQVIVQADVEPHPNAIGKLGLSVYVPGDVTSLTIPPETLTPGTSYQWEVLAIEESGNQTLSAGEFATE